MTAIDFEAETEYLESLGQPTTELGKYKVLCEQQQQRIEELLKLGNEELYKRRELERKLIITQALLDTSAWRIAQLEGKL